MKKLKKILLIVIVLVVVLGIAVVVLVGFNLDRIAKAGIETVGSSMTQTSVKLDSVSISTMSGSVGLKGFVIGNPEGYKASVMSIGKTAVSVTPRSLFAEKIIVHSIEVRDPEITFEGNPFGENNLKKIMANVNAGAAATPSGDTNKAASGQPKAAKKLQVDDFLITGAKVHATIPGLAGQEFTLPIPEIHFSDLGKGTDGITAAELTQKVLDKVSVETLKAIIDYVNKTYGANAETLIKGVQVNAEKVLGDSTEKLKKGLGGFLKK
jgi:uncharacterized protein involved in outer membrane biogenesis